MASIPRLTLWHWLHICTQNAECCVFMAALMQSPFIFQSFADHYRHLILAQQKHVNFYPSIGCFYNKLISLDDNMLRGTLSQWLHG